MRYTNRHFTYLLTYLPIPVLTGLDVEQLHWSRPTRYRYTKPPTANATTQQHLAPPSRPQRSSSFPQPIRSHAHRCSCPTC